LHQLSGREGGISTPAGLPRRGPRLAPALAPVLGASPPFALFLHFTVAASLPRAVDVEFVVELPEDYQPGPFGC